MLALQKRAEALRVPRREALPVVVEVDEQLGVRAHFAQPFGPLAQFGFRVVAAASARAVLLSRAADVGRLHSTVKRTTGPSWRQSVPWQEMRVPCQ